MDNIKNRLTGAALSAFLITSSGAWADSLNSNASVHKITSSIAAEDSYSRSDKKSGYKWGKATSPRASQDAWADAQQAKSGYKWGSVDATNSASNQMTSRSSQWATMSSHEQAGYKWGIRSTADQAGYKWGIRSAADQAGYKWGIRSTADQAGYKWGIRSTADQAGYKWGIR
ncbi:MAG: hypothetical protein ABJ056_04500 [Halioglobus sp.]